MNKDLLIFTGAGDNEDHFLSWAETTDTRFDRAVNYYGTDEQRTDFLRSKQFEFFYHTKGMIWENFYKNFHQYDGYSYYLIVDSDLLLDVENIGKSLDYMRTNKIHGSAWSRTDDSYGYFTPLFLSRKISEDVYYSNWIEMCFMLLSNELTAKTVNKWRELELSWSTGIDFIVANTAAENTMLPFSIFNNCLFRNLHPCEKKNGREIDIITNSTVEDRLADILAMIEADSFFKIKPTDISTWER